jgi:endonuclease I
MWKQIKTALTLAVWCVCSSMSVWALPESPHPYPNNFDQTQCYSNKGASGLEITFSAATCAGDGDFILVLDGQNRPVGKYVACMLAGQTVFVEGDTAYIQLVSDDSKIAYGYAVTHIRAIMAREYRVTADDDYTQADKLYNSDLKQELYNLVKNHTCLGYTGARQKMFGEIDNVSGYVECVYTGRLVKTTTIPDGNDMNTEHTWPKSQGAENDPALSDLHHLFPTDSETNSRRSNYPFGLVVVVTWSKGNSSLGTDSSNNIVFMPRSEHRGNVARAIFYFAIRYQLPVNNTMEQILKQWNQQDPVDSKERVRTANISQYQHNRNPFIDHPEYVDRIDDF